DEQEIGLEQYYSELGHGQHEISTPHAPALRAADEQLLVRETIRGVAARHGLVASLAPKPWPENAGNGCHIHFSLWDTDAQWNRFHDASAPDLLSADARSFIAGVLAHLPGLCGLTAPSFNSYHRIIPQYWAGAFVCWGHDNREAPVRVPSVFRGLEEASTNAELKAADASSNPYLAVGGLIAAGLDGLERGLEPPEPVEVDPATIDEKEREARGIVRLPATQAEALDALEADSVSTAASTSTSRAGSPARTSGTTRRRLFAPSTSRSIATCTSASWSGSTSRTWRSRGGSTSFGRGRARRRRCSSTRAPRRSRTRSRFRGPPPSG